MVDLNELSKIGFGCYRTTINSKEHYDALLYSLSIGCNLIDTSSNYMNGESEKLIGKVIKDNPAYNPFVVTKAGYILNEELAQCKLNMKDLDEEDIVSISDNFKYSIHPVFLENQLNQSLERLQKQIDGFLLHNPEHYFDKKGETTFQQYYLKIQNAFEFLEKKVAEGKIRYYGISSNTFPFSTEKNNTTNVHEVLAIARKISRNNHFKLIQFPFNLIEADALKPHHGGLSILKYAKTNNIVTMSNRPLNAIFRKESLRIATYENDIQHLNEREDLRVFIDCLNLISKQLQRQNIIDNTMEFTILKYLNDNWMTIDNPDAVDHIFRGYFYPFLNRIYQEKIPVKDNETYVKFHNLAILYSKKKMTIKAIGLKKKMAESGIIREDDDRPFPLLVCKHYLDSGIDHVLVGMRKIRYVEDFRSLF